MKIQNGTEQPRKTQPEFLVLTVLLFLVFVFGAGWVLFAPKQTFSEDENRALQPAPELSAKSLLDGSFMEDAAAFAGDHFPARRELISLYTTAQFASGKRDVGSNYAASPADGGVYFGSNGHLYEVLLPDKSDTFTQNAQALCNFAEAVDVPVYLLAALPAARSSRRACRSLRRTTASGTNCRSSRIWPATALWWWTRSTRSAVCTVISISKRTITGTPSALTRRISRCAAPWAWRPLRLTITISAP